MKIIVVTPAAIAVELPLLIQVSHRAVMLSGVVIGLLIEGVADVLDIEIIGAVTSVFVDVSVDMRNANILAALMTTVELVTSEEFIILF